MHMFMIQGLTTNFGDSFLPGDNYPSWLAYKGEGSSVLFQVPEDSDCCLKGITLCVLYSSTPENLATECLTNVLIINYTKFTIHIYKRDKIMSFNDEDWQGVVSNLGAGDNVEIFVAIGHGLTVKETAAYLIYDQSDATEVEPLTSTKIEPLREMEVQPSRSVKTEASAEEDVQPSPNVKTESSSEEPSPDVKMEPSLVVSNEPSPKKNIKIFTRLAKRVRQCLCLNQN
jgi:hypothetical protein